MNYNFERLKTKKYLKFPVSDQEACARVRSAAHQYGLAQGWEVRTAIDAKGTTLTVTRVEYSGDLPSTREVMDKRRAIESDRLERIRKKRAAKIARKYAEG
jgi:hypothetical protein